MPSRGGGVPNRRSSMTVEVRRTGNSPSPAPPTASDSRQHATPLASPAHAAIMGPSQKARKDDLTSCKYANSLVSKLQKSTCAGFWRGSQSCVSSSPCRLVRILPTPGEAHSGPGDLRHPHTVGFHQDSVCSGLCVSSLSVFRPRAKGSGIRRTPAKAARDLCSEPMPLPETSVFLSVPGRASARSHVRTRHRCTRVAADGQLEHRRRRERTPTGGGRWRSGGVLLPKNCRVDLPPQPELSGVGSHRV